MILHKQITSIILSTSLEKDTPILQSQSHTRPHSRRRERKSSREFYVQAKIIPKPRSLLHARRAAAYHGIKTRSQSDPVCTVLDAIASCAHDVDTVCKWKRKWKASTHFRTDVKAHAHCPPLPPSLLLSFLLSCPPYSPDHSSFLFSLLVHCPSTAQPSKGEKRPGNCLDNVTRAWPMSHLHTSNGTQFSRTKGTVGRQRPGHEIYHFNVTNGIFDVERGYLPLNRSTCTINRTSQMFKRDNVNILWQHLSTRSCGWRRKKAIGNALQKRIIHCIRTSVYNVYTRFDPDQLGRYFYYANWLAMTSLEPVEFTKVVNDGCRRIVAKFFFL